MDYATFCAAMAGLGCGIVCGLIFIGAIVFAASS